MAGQHDGPGCICIDRKRMARNITATSGPVPWPVKGPEGKWRVEAEPKSGTRIWTSTQGKVKWEAPPTEEFITFEERSVRAQHIDPWICDFET
eukprot:5987099-Lingulodinium_polyedra.AAC.1